MPGTRQTSWAATPDRCGVLSAAPADPTLASTESALLRGVPRAPRPTSGRLSGSPVSALRELRCRCRADGGLGIMSLARQLASDVALDGVQLAALFRCGEAGRVATGPGARGAADAMDVVLDRLRQIVIDDPLDV